MIALAPVASTANIANKYLVAAANKIRVLEAAIVHGLGYYNWFAPMPMAVGAIDVVCDTLPDVCKFIGKTVLGNDAVDNAGRFDVFMANEPSGSSYRTFIYYGQMIASGRYALYDYGVVENRKVYGQKEAPLVPIENYNVPTVLLSGDLDGLSTPTDVAFLSEKLGDKVVFQQQYHADHFTFAIGKDMSFFSVDAVNQLHKYNPISSSSQQQITTEAEVFLQ